MVYWSTLPRYIKCLKSTTFPDFHQTLATVMVCDTTVYMCVSACMYMYIAATQSSCVHALVHVCTCTMCVYITQYGSTVYIGIAVGGPAL